MTIRLLLIDPPQNHHKPPDEGPVGTVANIGTVGETKGTNNNHYNELTLRKHYTFRQIMSTKCEVDVMKLLWRHI